VHLGDELVKARVLNIQRMSTEDGPGIRTTVFFKGCPLNCSWCHNPESIDPGPRTVFHAERCIGCGSCASVCGHAALPAPGRGLRPDPGACRACGDCARGCPATALEVLGRDVTLEELVDELIRDRAYFAESGGGATASGGEPLVWSVFVARMFEALHGHGIACALDTCGYASSRALASAARHADLILFDLKAIDSTLHAQHTGRGNQRILENLGQLAASLALGQRLWIRTPLIPGATATADNVRRVGQYIASELGSAAERWELLAYNNLCREQYVRLGRAWPFADTPLLRQVELDDLLDAACRSGVGAERVVVTGPARLE
jgi:pyruvate formate lyase activating enzyme